MKIHKSTATNAGGLNDQPEIKLTNEQPELNLEQEQSNV